MVTFHSFSGMVLLTEFILLKFLKFGFFLVSVLGPESAVASVSVDDVRDVIMLAPLRFQTLRF